jgi:hypothetical protein
MFDLLLGRHAFFRSESHNLRRSMGICSRSAYMLPLAALPRLFQSKFPYPNLVTGQRRPWLSKQPTSLQTQHLSDSWHSRRWSRMLPLRRQAHPYLPCVRLSINPMHATSKLLHTNRWCGSRYFQVPFLGRSSSPPTTKLGHLSIRKNFMGMSFLCSQ